MENKNFIVNEISRLGNAVFALLPMFDDKDLDGMVRLSSRIIDNVSAIEEIYVNSPYEKEEGILLLISNIEEFVKCVNKDVYNLKKKYIRDNVLSLRNKISNLK